MITKKLSTIILSILALVLLFIIFKLSLLIFVFGFFPVFWTIIGTIVLFFMPTNYFEWCKIGIAIALTYFIIKLVIICFKSIKKK